MENLKIQVEDLDLYNLYDVEIENTEENKKIIENEIKGIHTDMQTIEPIEGEIIFTYQIQKLYNK